GEGGGSAPARGWPWPKWMPNAWQCGQLPPRTWSKKESSAMGSPPSRLCPVCAAAAVLATGLRATRLGLTPRLAGSLSQHTGRGPHVEFGRVQQRVALTVQEVWPSHTRALGFWVLGRDLDRLALRELLFRPGDALGQHLDPAWHLRPLTLGLMPPASERRLVRFGRGLLPRRIRTTGGALL